MNPIADLALGAITAFAKIAERRGLGEIDDVEGGRLMIEATHAHLARLDGFTLGLAAGDKSIDDRLMRLRAEFPRPTTSTPAPAPTTTTQPVTSPGAATVDR